MKAKKKKSKAKSKANVHKMGNGMMMSDKEMKGMMSDKKMKKKKGRMKEY